VGIKGGRGKKRQQTFQEKRENDPTSKKGGHLENQRLRKEGKIKKKTGQNRQKGRGRTEEKGVAAGERQGTSTWARTY